MAKKKLPVNKAMCKTCPFRPGSPYANLADYLTESALSVGSRICHNTGTSAVAGRTGKPAKICRGTRDIQLKVFCALGVVKKPTDESWDAAFDEIQAKKKTRKRRQA